MENKLYIQDVLSLVGDINLRGKVEISFDQYVKLVSLYRVVYDYVTKDFGKLPEGLKDCEKCFGVYTDIPLKIILEARE